MNWAGRSGKQRARSEFIGSGLQAAVIDAQGAEQRPELLSISPTSTFPFSLSLSHSLYLSLTYSLLPSAPLHLVLPLLFSLVALSGQRQRRTDT